MKRIMNKLYIVDVDVGNSIPYYTLFIRALNQEQAKKIAESMTYDNYEFIGIERVCEINQLSDFKKLIDN